MTVVRRPSVRSRRSRVLGASRGAGTTVAAGCLVVLALFAFWLLLVALSSAFYGFLVMLLFGILHGEVDPDIPALGFLTCWAIGAIFGVLFTRVRTTTTTNRS